MHDGAQLLSVPDDKEDICTSLRRELTSAGHTDESMALLRYIAESSDSESDMENTPPRHRFDVIRPGPLQNPQYLKDALHLMNTDILPPSPHQIEEWSSALTKALGNVDRDEVCRMTSEQSSCARWYTERLCRLTASEFRLIANRREKNMLTLVDQLLYSAPPVTTGPLKFGRDNEPIAVEKYKEYMHEHGHLVEVEKTGLHIHPSVSFLAASPDRLVLDPSCQPSRGLLEVKCMPSINGAPSDYAGKEKFCLRTAAGESQCRLSKQHSFYYQTQGQLACTARTWCDFVIMSQRKTSMWSGYHLTSSFGNLCVSGSPVFSSSSFPRSLFIQWQDRVHLYQPQLEQPHHQHRPARNLSNAGWMILLNTPLCALYHNDAEDESPPPVSSFGPLLIYIIHSLC